MTLHFRGQDFADVAALRSEYPAFASEGCVRAIRAGCDTVDAVEIFDWQARKVAYAKSVAGAKKSGFSADSAKGKIKRTAAQTRAAAKRGGLASARRGR